MPENLQSLTNDIRRWARELGFTRLGITDVDLAAAESRLKEWLERGYAGEMEWMRRHGTRRSRPPELVPGTVRVISVAMDYLPESQQAMCRALAEMDTGYISRYALGRDYHKVMRKRLATLAGRIREAAGEFGYRPFCDSAPVLEKPLAERRDLAGSGNIPTCSRGTRDHGSSSGNCT